MPPRCPFPILHIHVDRVVHRSGHYIRSDLAPRIHATTVSIVLLVAPFHRGLTWVYNRWGYTAGRRKWSGDLGDPARAKLQLLLTKRRGNVDVIKGCDELSWMRNDIKVHICSMERKGDIQSSSRIFRKSRE